MVREKQLLNKIRQLEKDLSDLRIQLERNQENEGRSGDTQIKKGQKVRILNPRPGQARVGTVSKINRETEWVTIETVVYSKGVKLRQKVSRHSKNVEGIES